MNDRKLCYPKLLKVLKQFDISEDIDIRFLYSANLGHLVFSEKKFCKKGEMDKLPITFYEAYSLTNIGSEDKLNDAICKEFISVFKNHPNIFDFDSNKECNINISDDIYGRFSLESEDPISFSMKIPKKQKKFHWVIDEIFFEEFNVHLFGSTYLAYAKIDDGPIPFHIGHELREQIRHNMDTDNYNYCLGQIGPNPIHPSLYLLSVSDKTYDKPSIFYKSNNIYVIMNLESEKDVYNVFLEILHTVKFPLEIFYRLCKTRSFAFGYYAELNQRLNDLANDCVKIQDNILGINFFKYKEISESRKKLLVLHKHNFEFDKLQNRFNEKRDFLSEILSSNNILNHNSSYFTKRDYPSLSDKTAFYHTIDFIERTIAFNDQAQRLILSVILGAILGAIVTLLLK